MTLKEIIGIADETYPDGLVGEAFRAKRDPGDTLALFIAKELKETFDEDLTDTEQLEAARRAMCAARGELQCVERAFECKLEAIDPQWWSANRA